MANPRLLLATVREGDFAHAGDREAIDIVLKELLPLVGSCEEKSSRNILDVGCGYGGTRDELFSTLITLSSV